MPKNLIEQAHGTEVGKLRIHTLRIFLHCTFIALPRKITTFQWCNYNDSHEEHTKKQSKISRKHEGN